MACQIQELAEYILANPDKTRSVWGQVNKIVNLSTGKNQKAGINISSKSSDALGKALTNKTYKKYPIEDVPGLIKPSAATQDGLSAEGWYKANQSLKTAPKLDMKKAIEYDMDLMQRIIVAKFKQYPELVQQITAKGGKEFIENSEHTVGVAGSRWEGKGLDSNFIKVLAKAYEDLVSEGTSDKDTKVGLDDNNTTTLEEELTYLNSKKTIKGTLPQKSQKVDFQKDNDEFVTGVIHQMLDGTRLGYANGGITELSSGKGITVNKGSMKDKFTEAITKLKTVSGDQKTAVEQAIKDGTFNKDIPKSRVLKMAIDVRREYDARLDFKIAKKLKRLYAEIEVLYLNSQTEMRRVLDELSGDIAMFQLSKKRKDEFEQKLRKARPELDGVKINEVLKSIEEFSETEGKGNEKLTKKLELLALHWTLKGNVVLPEDGSKIMQALKISEREKFDPFSYSNPNEITEKFANVSIKQKPIDPDNYIGKGFTNKKTYGDTVVYDVDNSELGRKVSRLAIDTHFGDDANPWCLLAKDDNGSIQGSASYWFDTYSGPKKIVFTNGKLSHFYGGDRFWDRMDSPSDSISGKDFEISKEDIKKYKLSSYIKDSDNSVYRRIDINVDKNGSNIDTSTSWITIEKRDIKENSTLITRTELWDNGNIMNEGVFESLKSSKNEEHPIGKHIHYRSNGKIISITNYNSNYVKTTYEGYSDKGILVQKEEPVTLPISGQKVTTYFVTGDVKEVVIKRPRKPSVVLEEYFSKDIKKIPAKRIKYLSTDNDGRIVYIEKTGGGDKKSTLEIDHTSLKLTYTDFKGNKDVEKLSSPLSNEEIIELAEDVIYYQKTKNDIIKGAAVISKNKILIDIENRSTDTLAHEYAHFYIAAFRDTPIVQEAIKKFGNNPYKGKIIISNSGTGKSVASSKLSNVIDGDNLLVNAANIILKRENINKQIKSPSQLNDAWLMLGKAENTDKYKELRDEVYVVQAQLAKKESAKGNTVLLASAREPLVAVADVIMFKEDIEALQSARSDLNRENVLKMTKDEIILKNEKFLKAVKGRDIVKLSSNEFILDKLLVDGEEALVQAIGEQVVKQKGEVYGWWKEFSSWLKGLFIGLDKASKEDLVQLLTDAFLTRQDLDTRDQKADIIKSSKIKSKTVEKAVEARNMRIKKVAKNLWWKRYAAEAKQIPGKYNDYYGAMEKTITKIMDPKVVTNVVGLMLEDVFNGKFQIVAGDYDPDTHTVQIAEKPRQMEIEMAVEEGLQEEAIRLYEDTTENMAYMAKLIEDYVNKNRANALAYVISSVESVNGGHTTTHELIHAGSVNFMRDPKNANHPAVLRVKELYKEALARESDIRTMTRTGDVYTEYWKKSEEEFISEALSNPQLMYALSNIKTVGKEKLSKGLFAELVKSLIKMLGLNKKTEDNLLEFTMDGFAAIMEAQAVELSGPINKTLVTNIPAKIYHGFKGKITPYINEDGNLVMKPSKNFGGKTTSISFTHSLDTAYRYAAQVKGEGPLGYDFINAKVFEIDSRYIDEILQRESEEEWAINTNKNVVIPKKAFKVIEHPLTSRLSKVEEEYPFKEFIQESNRENEFDGYGDEKSYGNYFEEYLDTVIAEYDKDPELAKDIYDTMEYLSDGDYADLAITSESEVAQDKRDTMTVKEILAKVDKMREECE